MTNNPIQDPKIYSMHDLLRIQEKALDDLHFTKADEIEVEIQRRKGKRRPKFTERGERNLFEEVEG